MGCQTSAAGAWVVQRHQGSHLGLGDRCPEVDSAVADTGAIGPTSFQTGASWTRML